MTEVRTETQLLDDFAGGQTDTLKMQNMIVSLAANAVTERKAATNDSGVGTANTGVTATEYGDAHWHKTVLTLSALALLDAGDNASLAIGKLLYTFPAGVIVVESAHLNVGVTIDGTPTTDTPEIGLGTVIATGAVAVLGGTATFENIIEGAAMADVAGTAKLITQVSNLAIPAASAHTVHLNLADAWADTDTQGLTATGTVVLVWRKLT